MSKIGLTVIITSSSSSISGLNEQTLFDIAWANQAIREYFKIDDNNNPHRLAKSIINLMKSEDVQKSLLAVKSRMDSTIDSITLTYHVHQYRYNGIYSRLKETLTYVENAEINRSANQE